MSTAEYADYLNSVLSKPVNKKSLEILYAKRRATAGYSSDSTMRTLVERVENRPNGKSPYAWQNYCAEASILGLCSVIIAPTGAGKTLPPAMPLFLHDSAKDAKLLVISPLIELMFNQVFHCTGLTTDLTSSIGRELYGNGLECCSTEQCHRPH